MSFDRQAQERRRHPEYLGDRYSYEGAQQVLLTDQRDQFYVFCLQNHLNRHIKIKRRGRQEFLQNLRNRWLYPSNSSLHPA